jgi:hypothetical protein
MKRAQAALEFLTTYAWAFIVILVTLGSLYYFGVFDFSRFVPEQCVFSAQFACTDFVITQNSLSVKLSNTLAELLNITSAEITNDASSPISCNSPIGPSGMSWGSGISIGVNFTSCEGGGLLAGERIDARIRLVYHSVSSPSKTAHSLQGKISGQVLRG